MGFPSEQKDLPSYDENHRPVGRGKNTESLAGKTKADKDAGILPFLFWLVYVGID